MLSEEQERRKSKPAFNLRLNCRTTSLLGGVVTRHDYYRVRRPEPYLLGAHLHPRGNYIVKAGNLMIIRPYWSIISGQYDEDSPHMLLHVTFAIAPYEDYCDFESQASSEATWRGRV